MSQVCENSSAEPIEQPAAQSNGYFVMMTIGELADCKKKGVL